MSEWMTTGEMIDRLKLGEVAESDRQADLRVKYAPIGIIYLNDKGGMDKYKGQDGYLFINGPYVKNTKWRILPNYVSFEEALKAYEKGNVVKSWLGNETLPYHVHYPNNSRHFNYHFELIDDELERFNEVKWTVEND